MEKLEIINEVARRVSRIVGVLLMVVLGLRAAMAIAENDLGLAIWKVIEGMVVFVAWDWMRPATET